MKKYFVSAALFLGIIISAGCGKTTVTGAPQVEVKVKEVKKGDIIEKLAEVGKLEPVSSVKVKSNVTGTVKKLLVDDGTQVKSGQLLAVILPGREAEKYLASEVRAAASGVIIEKAVEEGDMVTSGLSEYSGGSVIMSIADMSKMLVKVDINEVDISKVKVGLPAKIRVEAYSKKEFMGKVTKISPMAKLSTDGKINVFKTEVEVTTKTTELRPGMKTVVEIKLDERKDVIIMPIEAVFEEKDPETEINEQVIYILKPDGKYERRGVKVGLFDDNNIEVLEGAVEKDKVALSRPVGFENFAQKKEDRSRSRGNPPGGAMRGL
ncbi:MAG: efflux RND transporter periplasmic adaptor subunit [Candidatus Firestonebacteria bacterium]